MPIGIAPTAMQKMAHPDGELATAKGNNSILDTNSIEHSKINYISAAEKLGTLYILSTIATSSIEEIAHAAPNGLKWYQLYIYRDR